MQTHLEGLIAAPFTPMNADGSLQLSLIPAYYALLQRNGVAGAFIAGSTGEGVSLTMSEKMQLTETWAAATKADKEFKVIALVGGTSMNDCISLARHAKEAGLYGIALTAPFYFKPADAQVLAQLCKTVADAVVDMPFYYYHIPVLTGCYIPMYDLLKAINGSIPNFYGIKYTHEDFMDFQSCMNIENGRYDMLWGRDENMLSALVLGAKGAVGSTYNYAAPLYQALIAAFEANDLPKARALQQKAIDMIRLLGKYGGIATGKAFMRLLNIDCGQFRLPVKNMDAEQFTQFKKDVEMVGFADFQSV